MGKDAEAAVEVVTVSIQLRNAHTGFEKVSCGDAVGCHHLVSRGITGVARGAPEDAPWKTLRGTAGRSGSARVTSALRRAYSRLSRSARS